MCTSTKDSEIVDMINKLVGFKLKSICADAQRQQTSK